MMVRTFLSKFSEYQQADIGNYAHQIHLEGPIVDSFYDMFLISWNNAFREALPFLSSPAASTASEEGITAPSPSRQYHFASENPFLHAIDVVKSAEDARATLNREAENDRLASAAQQQASGSGLSFAAAVRDIMEERRRLRQLPPEAGPSVDGGTGEEPRLAPATRFTNAVQNLIEERRKSKAAGVMSSVGIGPPPNVNSSLPDETCTQTNERDSSTLATNPATADSPSATAVGSGCSDIAESSAAPPKSSEAAAHPKSRVSIQADPSNAQELQKHHQRHFSNDTNATLISPSSHRRQRSIGSKDVKNRMRALSDALVRHSILVNLACSTWLHPPVSIDNIPG